MKRSKQYYLEVLLGHNDKIDKIRCERCKGDKVASQERQIRSSDEGVSIMHVCQECKYVWWDNLD